MFFRLNLSGQGCPMRYLELAELSQLNTLLADIQSDDGGKIFGRVECYSCKAAGQDKKLLRKLAKKFPEGISDEMLHELSLDEYSTNILSSPGGPGPASSSNAETLKHGMPLKLFYFLVSTMNLMFPDYDFTDVNPNIFKRQGPLNNVINHVNATIFNTGANKNYESFSEFTRKMWDCIDTAIELHECDIYSFDPEQEVEIDDPFTERGVIWSLNYFFWNKKQKRLLVVNLKCFNPLENDGEYFDYPFSPRSITPV